MRHLDPETLGLLALGEEVADRDAPAHLLLCAECSTTVRELAAAAAVGRTALSVGTLDEPHARVWESIASELGLAASVPAAPTRMPLRRLRPGRLGIAWLSAAAAVIALIVSGVVWQASQATAPRTVATAALNAFPHWRGATGKAVVDELTDGRRVVSVTLEAPPRPGTYREVWLITADTKKLVSLGRMRGDTGVFNIPTGIDLRSYDLVDVSNEPRDGNPAHSGDSIVRGALTS